jgi:hypothetical protein
MSFFEYLLAATAVVVAYLYGVNSKINKYERQAKYDKSQVTFWRKLFEDTRQSPFTITPPPITDSDKEPS